MTHRPMGKIPIDFFSIFSVVVDLHLAYPVSTPVITLQYNDDFADIMEFCRDNRAIMPRLFKVACRVLLSRLHRVVGSTVRPH